MKQICLLNEASDFSESALSILESKFLVKSVDNLHGVDHNNVEVMFIRLRDFVGKEKLRQYPNLKYLCSPTTGLNHIDVKFCQNNKIKVISLKGEVEFLSEYISATAEFTWGLFLSAWRKIVVAERDVRSGHWNRDKFRSQQLKGKTINILGMGRVGKRIVKYANAFELNVRYYDPEVSEVEGKCESLSDLVKNAEILLVCCSYNNTTHDIVNSEVLEKLSDGALLINTARGEIVDETAVAKYVRIKQITYATDVIKDEQNFQSAFLENALFAKNLRGNVIVTPHIAGACYDSMHLTEIFIANKLMDMICLQD